MLGLTLAIDVIFSRSSDESERVGRLRSVSMKRVSSAARAASAGDVESPRVILGGVNALMICSEVCSAALADSIADGRASPAARTTQAR